MREAGRRRSDATTAATENRMVPRSDNRLVPGVPEDKRSGDG